MLFFPSPVFLFKTKRARAVVSPGCCSGEFVLSGSAVTTHLRWSEPADRLICNHKIPGISQTWAAVPRPRNENTVPVAGFRFSGVLGLLVIYRGCCCSYRARWQQAGPVLCWCSALPSASFSPLTGGQRSGQARRAPVLVAVGTGRTSPPLAAAEAQRSSLRYSETAPRGRALEAELSQLVTRCCWRASPRELSDTQVTETQLLAELWEGAGVTHRRVLAVEEGGV